MGYTLISTERKVATERLRADCYESWCDWMKKPLKVGEKREYKKYGDAMILYSGKNGIPKGETYIERIFVDEEGQQYYLHSLPGSDKAAIANEIYFPEILNQIK